MTESVSTPLVGCNAVNHHDAPAYHARWFFIDENNNWINKPDLFEKINVNIRFGYLVLTAPGMLRLDIPLDVIEDDDSVRLQANVEGQGTDVVNEGEVASAWASACLGMPASIVKLHPEASPVNWPE